ncbi:hypothetical protein [Streptomyces sp. P5_D11]
MGNSMAYPVLRTTDAAEAYAKGKRLCAFLELREDEIQLCAELRTVADVRRMATALPQARFHEVPVRPASVTGDGLWHELDLLAADDAILAAELPLTIMEDVRRGSAEERFVQALGLGYAAIDWCGRWPDEPETDSYGTWSCDGVQVVFNGDNPQWSGWAAHHTVFVHVGKMGDLPRAQRLAAHIGGEVLGEPLLGW